MYLFERSISVIFLIQKQPFHHVWPIVSLILPSSTSLNEGHLLVRVSGTNTFTEGKDLSSTSTTAVWSHMKPEHRHTFPLKLTTFAFLISSVLCFLLFLNLASTLFHLDVEKIFFQTNQEATESSFQDLSVYSDVFIRVVWHKMDLLVPDCKLLLWHHQQFTGSPGQ